MKKLIAVAACVGVTSMALGQGLFNLGTKMSGAGINAKVTHIDGTTPIDGANGWVGQAYVGADASSLAPVGSPVAFRTGRAEGYLPSMAIDAGVPGGTTVWVAIAAWNQNDGATYEDAMNALGAVGMSAPIQVTVLEVPNPPPNLVGLEGWVVAPIPEPSTLALGLLGIGALMLRRRK